MMGVSCHIQWTPASPKVKDAADSRKTRQNTNWIGKRALCIATISLISLETLIVLLRRPDEDPLPNALLFSLLWTTSSFW